MSSESWSVHRYVPSLIPNPTGDGASVDNTGMLRLMDELRAEVEPLCIEDIRAAKLDREPWGKGAVHPEVAYAVLVQVMKSIRDEQPTASAVVRGLAAAALEAIE